MSTVERIHAQILHRRKDGIEEQIDLALQDLDAVTVLNTVLLPAMKDVGDRFGSGELILPVRAAERRGDEARGRASRAVPREA